MIAKMKYLVSAVQMSSQGDIAKNIAEALNYIKQAASQGVDLVCLPENFATYGCKDFVSFAKEEVKSCQLQNSLAELSDHYGIHILAGSMPLWDEQSGKCFNASLLFSPNLGLVAQYNKMHLFDANVSATQEGSYRESSHYQAGAKVVCADLGKTKLGMAICYDLRFPELFQQLRSFGADFISLPSAFTYVTGKKHWQVLLKARAIETQCFIIASNQTGLHANQRRTWGHSMIISPDGEILAEAGEEQGLITAECDLNLLDEIRLRMPIWQHKRLV